MKLPLFLCVALAGLVSGSVRAAELPVISLWEGHEPGVVPALPAEVDTTKPNGDLVAGQRVIRLGNVSHPTLTIYKPDPARDTGTTVLVCPGGGYNILALDLEGTEVCTWLNSIGVTGALLKYRVPVGEGKHPKGAPLQDAQRALGLLRSRAAEFHLNPDRIGVLGFSAGGHLAANLSNNHETRTYPLVDAADKVSCRPDFCFLIYPGYLAIKDKNDALNPDLALSRTNTPPTFIVMAEDDPVRVENASVYYLAAKQAGVATEMHLYPKGGHGYGLRRTGMTVTTWPDRATEWMTASGWLDPKK